MPKKEAVGMHVNYTLSIGKREIKLTHADAMTIYHALRAQFAPNGGVHCSQCGKHNGFYYSSGTATLSGGPTWTTYTGANCATAANTSSVATTSGATLSIAAKPITLAKT